MNGKKIEKKLRNELNSENRKSKGINENGFWELGKTSD